MSAETIEHLGQTWKAQKEALELQLEESNKSYQRLYNVFKSTRAAEAKCHSLQIQLDEANDLIRGTKAKCHSLQGQLNEVNDLYRSECCRGEVLLERIVRLERDILKLSVCDGQ